MTNMLIVSTLMMTVLVHCIGSVQKDHFVRTIEQCGQTMHTLRCGDVQTPTGTPLLTRITYVNITQGVIATLDGCDSYNANCLHRNMSFNYGCIGHEECDITVSFDPYCNIGSQTNHRLYVNIIYHCAPDDNTIDICRDNQYTDIPYGYIYSPRYPGNYPVSKTCTCTIQSNTNSYDIFILDMNLEHSRNCEQDKLEIYLDNYEGQSSYCNMSSSQIFPPYHVNNIGGKTATIEFTSSYMLTNKGFMVHFKAKPSTNQQTSQFNVYCQDISPIKTVSTTSTPWPLPTTRVTGDPPTGNPSGYPPTNSGSPPTNGRNPPTNGGPGNPGASTGDKTGLYAGIGAGCAAVILIVVIVTVVCIRKRNTSSASENKMEFPQPMPEVYKNPSVKTIPPPTAPRRTNAYEVPVSSNAQDYSTGEDLYMEIIDDEIYSDNKMNAVRSSLNSGKQPIGYSNPAYKTSDEKISQSVPPKVDPVPDYDNYYEGAKPTDKAHNETYTQLSSKN